MQPWWNDLQTGLQAVNDWQERWASIPAHPSLRLDADVVTEALAAVADRLTDNYPFHHPVYAGQMLKPPHPVAMMAYTMAMQINPNNHALDGGPATAKMEREVVALIATMFGYEEHLGHLTSSGTFANLEALWVARCLHPGKAIAYSSQAHYTHGRMCEVLGIKGVPIGVDDRGRLDVDDLMEKLEHESIGTVVATLGTTGLGAIDPVDRLVALGREHGFRVHVDAAYGGFFRLLADLEFPQIDAAPFLHTHEADSIVIDPHKHGLQPYGCGCVLFRDPTVGRFYQHDSPYTYFTSDALHLGEISLECSRAGASAAALWATLRCFPLSPVLGLGPVLTATRAAALKWAKRIDDSQYAQLVLQPQLDILCFFPLGGGWKASAISAETERVFRALMNHPEEPVYLAKVALPRALVERRHPRVEWDQETLTVLRSVLMKPEHETLVSYLHGRLEHEAWWPGAEIPQPPVKGNSLTGPLGMRADWENGIQRFYDRYREQLVTEMRALATARFHPEVTRLDFELRPPYGLAGEMGLYAIARGSDGEVVYAPGRRADSFAGTRGLLMATGPVVPRDFIDHERFALLWNSPEDPQGMAANRLIEFVAECWKAADGPATCRTLTCAVLEGEEDALDLATGAWFEAKVSAEVAT